MAMDKAATPIARFIKAVKLSLAHKAIQSLLFFPQSVLKNGAQFGQSVEFTWWIRRHFGKTAPFFPSREKLWQKIILDSSCATSLQGYEFGVAYGYLTSWWLKRCPAITAWNGFDTFTGLPDAWLHFEQGAFDAKGNPPEIDDERVRWVIGKVEETFSPATLSESDQLHDDSCNRIFFFDMDLYRPTRHALDIILPHLKAGDILYFDEAGDLDERRVLIESYDILRETTCLIGYTPMAMALRRTQ